MGGRLAFLEGCPQRWVASGVGICYDSTSLRAKGHIALLNFETKTDVSLHTGALRPYPARVDAVIIRFLLTLLARNTGNSTELSVTDG